jgi:hypothetical protein
MLVFEETADKLELAAPKRDKGTNASKPLTSVIRIPSTVSARSNTVLKSFEFVLVPRDRQARLPILVEDARRGKRPLWLARHPGPRIAGMIGGALFLTCPSRLEFARREWTLYENAEGLTPSTTANVWRFPMRHGKESQAPLLRATLKAGDGPGDFEIATAHAYSTLPEWVRSVLESHIRRQNFIPADVFDG